MHLFFRSASLCFGVFTLLSAAPAWAVVTVVMDNGDLLTGDIVQKEAEGLKLKVEYLGEVSLPKARVDNWSVLFPEDAVASEASKPAAEEAPSQKKEVASSGVDSAPVKQGAKAATPRRALAPALAGYSDFVSTLLPFHEWKKRLQLGMTSQSGRRDKTDFNYRFDMNLKRKKEQFRFNAAYYYGETDDVKTAGKFSSDLRWRRDFAPGVFYETETSYFSDEIKLIDANIEQKVGLGTRLVDSEVMTLSSGLGASGRWREFEANDEEVDYLVDLFQDWDYRINERLRLRQDFRFAVPLENSDEYEYEFMASLVSELTEAINLSLRYELGFDNSLREALREETRFVSSLGYSF